MNSTPTLDYTVPLDSFITEVSVNKPTQEAVREALEGYLQDYSLQGYWIPQPSNEF